jgi:hypothetical protein
MKGMKREPLKPKQKLLVMVTAFVLYLPAFLFIVCYRNHFSPRQMGAIGAVNLVVGVYLLALISEKWIRKMK